MNLYAQTSTKKTKVTEIATIEDFNKIGKNVKPTITEVYAEWCTACKNVAPKVDSASNKFNQVKFYRVNIDKVPQVGKTKNIKALPTFIFKKQGAQEIQIAACGDIDSAVAQFIKQGKKD